MTMKSMLKKDDGVNFSGVSLKEEYIYSEIQYNVEQNFSNLSFWNVNATDKRKPADNLALDYAALLIIPIIIFVAVGNILVIVAVGLDKKLRSATNCFLSSLAVADLLVALSVMPPSLAMIINKYQWPFSDDACGLWVMLDVFFSTSSILHLCMISLDRYFALARPFHHSNAFIGRGGGLIAGGTPFSAQTKSKKLKRVSSRIFMVWATALGIAIPLPILGKFNRGNLFVDGMCVINIAEFQLFGSLAAFFLPLIIMFVVYTLTIRTLRSQERFVSNMLASCNKLSPQSRKPSLNRRGFQQSNGTEKGEGNRRVYTARQFQRQESALSEEGIYDSAFDNSRSMSMNRELPNKSFFCHKCDLIFETGVKKRCWTAAVKHVQTIVRIKRFSMKRTTRRESAEPKRNQGCTCQLTISQNQEKEKLNQADLQHASFPRKHRSSMRRTSTSLKNRAIADISNEQRASKVLGLIFVLFCLFWCPFFITNVTSRLCSSCDQSVMGELMNWFVWIGYVSSGVNPIVYTMFSRRFRKTFSLLLKCKISEINQHQFKRSLSYFETSGASFRSTTGSGARNSIRTFQPADSSLSKLVRQSSVSEYRASSSDLCDVASTKNIKVSSKRNTKGYHQRSPSESATTESLQSSLFSNNRHRSITEVGERKNERRESFPFRSRSFSAKQAGERFRRLYRGNDSVDELDAVEEISPLTQPMDDPGGSSTTDNLSIHAN